MHSSRTSAASRKSHNDRNQQILKALLKEPANKTCSDCKTATHPRWASWNLGCFICIRCSGIHRSMGTHISRVKSVDLDSWTDEQVKSVVSWGNAKSNWFWEAGLPENYVPDDSKIENFIRTKYEKKKWARSGTVPDPNAINVGQQQQPAAAAAAQLREKAVPALPQEHAPAAKPESQPQKQSGSLLDLDFGTISPSPVNSLSSASLVSQPQTQSLPNLQSSLFSESHKSKPQAQYPQQQQQQQQQNNSKPDLKKSILSLYSTPTSSTPSFYPPQQQIRPVQQQQTFPQMSPSAFSTQPSAPQAQVPQQQQQQQQAFPANPWSSNSSNVSRTTKSPLEDDLFKNVWS